jgi:hypothetical protein
MDVGAVSTRQRSFHFAPGLLCPRPSFMAAAHDGFLEGRPERTLHSVCQRSPTHAPVRAHGPPPDARSERNGGSIPLRPPRKARSGGERCPPRERSPEWKFHSAPGVARLGSACRGSAGLCLRAEPGTDVPFRTPRPPGPGPAQTCIRAETEPMDVPFRSGPRARPGPAVSGAPLTRSGGQNGSSIPLRTLLDSGLRAGGSAGLCLRAEVGTDVPFRTPRPPAPSPPSMG